MVKGPLNRTRRRSLLSLSAAQVTGYSHDVHQWHECQRSGMDHDHRKPTTWSLALVCRGRALKLIATRYLFTSNGNSVFLTRFFAGLNQNTQWRSDAISGSGKPPPIPGGMGPWQGKPRGFSLFVPPPCSGNYCNQKPDYVCVTESRWSSQRHKHAPPLSPEGWWVRSLRAVVMWAELLVREGAAHQNSLKGDICCLGLPSGHSPLEGGGGGGGG